jgi:hypothetical protein
MCKYKDGNIIAKDKVITEKWGGENIWELINPSSAYYLLTMQF